MKFLYALIASAILTFASCSDEGSGAIRFLLPPNFTGKFSVHTVEKDGVDPKPTKRKDGKDEYLVAVPATTIVDVNPGFSARVVYRWHNEIAEYPDGTELPLGEQAKPAERAFYALWEDGHKTVWYLVGTRQDFLDAWSHK